MNRVIARILRGKPDSEQGDVVSKTLGFVIFYLVVVVVATSISISFHSSPEPETPQPQVTEKVEPSTPAPKPPTTGLDDIFETEETQ